MAAKAVDAVKNFVSRFGVKAPWKMTGVASTPEFLNAAPAALEWRKNSPGSPKLKAVVPHAETDRVYDIRYWIRDTRREGMLVGGTNKKHVAKYEVAVRNPSDALAGVDAPPRIGKPFKWTQQRELLDVDNNGYT